MAFLQFAGLPGGPELLVVLFVALLLFGIPTVLVLVFGVAWLRSSGRASEERVERLETEIEALRAELDGADGEENEATASADDRPESR